MKIDNLSIRSRPPVVLVLGGNGFVGRYTVKELLCHHAQVIIGTRNAKAARGKCLADCRLQMRGAIHESNPRSLEFRQIRIQDLQDPLLWNAKLAGVDVVINAVGILRERGNETFNAVHNTGVGALARACCALDIPLVHVSALGIDQSVNNEFSLSKLRGEQSIISSGCRASIVRASVVDAPDGYGSGWFRRVAQWPVQLLPAGATKLISPIVASNLGEALSRLALSHLAIPETLNRRILQDAATHSSLACRLYEVGCGEIFDLAGYLQRLRRNTESGRQWPLLRLRVPGWLARLAALAFDQLNVTPYSIGHHELLENDNIPRINALPLILGRAPLPIVAPVDCSCREHALESLP